MRFFFLKKSDFLRVNTEQAQDDNYIGVGIYMLRETNMLDTGF